MLQKDPDARYEFIERRDYPDFVLSQKNTHTEDERPTAVQAMEHKWITMHADADDDIHTKQNGLKSSLRSTTFQKFLAMQKLKKAALVVIASNLTQDEVGSLGDIFRRIDQSGDGVMTLTELDDAISRGR